MLAATRRYLNVKNCNYVKIILFMYPQYLYFQFLRLALWTVLLIFTYALKSNEDIRTNTIRQVRQIHVSDAVLLNTFNFGRIFRRIWHILCMVDIQNCKQTGRMVQTRGTCVLSRTSFCMHYSSQLNRSSPYIENQIKETVNAKDQFILILQ